MFAVVVRDLLRVSQGALHEEGHHIAADMFLQVLGGDAGPVCRDDVLVRPHQQVGGEIVDHRQRGPVQPVDSKDADLRVDRAQGLDLFIRDR